MYLTKETAPFISHFDSRVFPRPPRSHYVFIRTLLGTTTFVSVGVGRPASCRCPHSLPLTHTNLPGILVGTRLLTTPNIFLFSFSCVGGRHSLSQTAILSSWWSAPRQAVHCPATPCQGQRRPPRDARHENNRLVCMHRCACAIARPSGTRPWLPAHTHTPRPAAVASCAMEPSNGVISQHTVDAELRIGVRMVLSPTEAAQLGLARRALLPGGRGLESVALDGARGGQWWSHEWRWLK